MITKSEWIEAYRQTLSEYEAKQHDADIRLCSKCQLIIKRYETFPDCNLCLESGHKVMNQLGRYPCCKRYTSPDNSSGIADTTPQIEYHKRAIKMLEELPEDGNWFETAKTKLFEIDQQIKEEYETNLQV